MGKVMAYMDSLVVDQAAEDLSSVASNDSQLNDPLRWLTTSCK